ncbi:MAG: BamA/TamA family outer membrane protein [Thermodesulfobacteriota bacterium]
MKATILIFLTGWWLWTGSALCAWAGESEPATAPAGATAGEIQDYQKWAFFPVIASSTETGLQLGALAVRFFQPDTPGGKSSTIDFIGFGTVEGQYFAGITPNFYFNKELYHAFGSLSGKFWPANYYGIGNDTAEENKETYDATGVGARIGLERKFFDLFHAGVLYRYVNERMDAPENGELVREGVTGVDGGVRSGAGVVFSHDTRDNINDARRGAYLRYEALFFEEGLGSDYRYLDHELDLRTYWPTTPSTSLAVRGFLTMKRGRIPFQDLSTPDGFDLLRGIEKGRYRERDMAAAQLEWRFPIYGRFNGTVFAETAQTAYEISALNNDGWKYSLGSGLRYALNPAERFNIRLDLSFVDGGFGLALGIREAF